MTTSKHCASRLEIVACAFIILLTSCYSAPLQSPASRVLTSAEDLVKYTSPEGLPNLILVPRYQWDNMRDYILRHKAEEKMHYIEGVGK